MPKKPAPTSDKFMRMTDKGLVPSKFTGGSADALRIKKPRAKTYFALREILKEYGRLTTRQLTDTYNKKFGTNKRLETIGKALSRMVVLRLCAAIEDPRNAGRMLWYLDESKP